MTFKRIREDKNIKEKNTFYLKMGLALISVVLLIFLLLWLQLNIIFSVGLVVLFVLILRQLRKLLPDWVTKKDVIGELTLGNNKISYSNPTENIPYGDIKAIILKCNYIKGKKLERKDILHNGLASMTIKTNQEEQKTLKFLVETNEQWQALKNEVNKWYQLNIQVQESLFNDKYKTHCLEVLSDKPSKKRRSIDN